MHRWAISVHRAQGTEFPAEAVPLLTSQAVLLGRTLLYTAVTRARRLVVLVGQRRALELAVRDWRRAPRQTALAGLLRGELGYTWNRAGSTVGGGDTASWDGVLDRTAEGDL